MTADMLPDEERDAPSGIVDVATSAGLTCERYTQAPGALGRRWAWR